ncbi:MAG: single-stranded-DNA-specific exonuclease RecJ, partial [Actinomycetota bacterium]|nr:single-stranded-DNA-specific exonuclease RecJ [Actinomycetota bacterium]
MSESAALVPKLLVSAASSPPVALRSIPGGAAIEAPAVLARRLELPSYDLAAAVALERELGISHVLGQVLVRRGFREPEAARAFLNPREAHDPLEFTGIEPAIETIGRHIAAGTRITVHGDYDVDGICATAILIRALRSLGANAGWFLPNRVRDGYGLSPATIERLAARGTALLITVDCGITAVDEVAAATAAGLEVIVTDHHSPRADGELPACAIVHPAVCGYPCPDLCGSGVAFKLAQALGAPSTKQDLELVALATVADLVPLRGENRRLVREGLAELAGTAKPGLRALLEVSGADPSALDTQAIGFRLAPRINAAGRIRSPDAGLELLLTDSEERAREIAAELDSLNHERRAVEERIGWEAEAQVAELGERYAYVLAGEGWHPGVIGIVASRVVERHHRPTILLALDGERPAQGSGRSIPGFDLLAALHEAAGEMVRYGGHRAAAGLTLTPDRIPALRATIEAHAQRVLTPELLTPVQRIDAIASGGELGLGVAEELLELEPCGMGNPRTRLLVPGARFTDVRPMGDGGRHARFSVSSGGARARAVAFGCDGRPAEGAEGPLDATFRLERNVWKGTIEPRLVLSHATPCSPDPIEVLGEPEDFLVAVLEELDADLDAEEPSTPENSRQRILARAAEGRTILGDAVGRTVLDRRGESPLAVLADACSAGPTLAVCADVPRRLPGLAARAGGFALISAPALEVQPRLAHRFTQLVVLDPPTSDAVRAAVQRGFGFTHWAWGDAELRFAEQMHELEYGLRTSLVSLYRALKLRQRVVGGELERLLRGDGPHGRPA